MARAMAVSYLIGSRSYSEFQTAWEGGLGSHCCHEALDAKTGPLKL